MLRDQRPDEVICISGLFTNYILTYNSSDRLADFIGASLLLLGSLFLPMQQLD